MGRGLLAATGRPRLGCLSAAPKTPVDIRADKKARSGTQPVTWLDMNSIIIKPKAQKVLERRHPWIFSGAIAETRGTPRIGETVSIMNRDNVCLGRGSYSPHSQIRVRVWSFDPDVEISASFFKERLRQAIEARKCLPNKNASNAFRLVNAEADGLPGLIVDRYDQFLVCQFLAAGVERWKSDIIGALEELSPCRGIYERSDVKVRKKEGLPLSKGRLSGEEPPDLVEIKEGEYRFWADIKNGHKTGFYLDQRENRSLARQFADGAETLNCFSYTGGFAVAAISGGAVQVVNVDSSAAVLELARRNIELNNPGAAKVENLEGNAFSILRQFRDSRRQFDLIILDPPKFAESRAGIKSAARGYKDINLAAFKLLRDGGALFTFSCSGLLSESLFRKIVADAALDAGRDARVLHCLSQSPDHPSTLHFPEGQYLKGLVCQAF